jgi:hypothetical protein
MKNILAVILFLSLLTTSAQVSNSSYPYQKAEWTYLQKWENWFVSNPPYVYYSFLVCKLDGDTVWDGKQYNKIIAPGYAGTQFMRKWQDSLFTCLASASDSAGHQTFNFSADVGDSIGGENGEVAEAWMDTLMNGDVKRVLVFMNQSNAVDTVIEDLGQVNLPVFKLTYPSDPPVWSRLVCFKDSSHILYYIPFNYLDTSGSYVNPCSIHLAPVSETKFDAAFEVRHDMAGNMLMVTVPKEAEGTPFSIVDVTGKTVQSVKLTGGKNYVSTAALSGGLYLYTTTKGNYFHAGKFVVR